MMTNIHDIYFIIFSTNEVNLIPLGLFALVLSQAVALAQRFSKSFSDVENLSEKLKIKNENLEEEITERTKLEREIVNISDEERRSMSQDLHDGLCQQLTGARLRCAALSRVGQGSDNNNEELHQLSALLDELVDQAYDLSCGIWPLENGATDTGLSREDMIQRYSRSSGIPIEVREKWACETCQNMHITQIYRIAQEAITNAVKHANPTQIIVSLDCVSTDMVTLTVRDDGVGRSAAAHSKGGLGVSIMAHRAKIIGGHFQIVDIDEAEGGGTMVVCSFPCPFGTSKQHKNDQP
ncbi:MAG: hypothetical protein JEY79_19650 [Pseudodesulfovibrio sp.]|nr:hypothetical protein [Pseudodesulfovibrio sp.]